MKLFMQLNLTILAIALVSGVNFSHAEEVLDQEFDATGGGGSVAVANPFGYAQTFTVGRDGILSRVALMLGRTEQATGDFTLMILPTTSGGLPDGSGAVLFSSVYPVTVVSAIGPFQYTYTSFDISSAAISVEPGDQFAIAVTRQNSSVDEWLQWDVNVVGGYAGGSSYVDTTGGIDDWEVYGYPGPGAFGFQTFVSLLPSMGPMRPKCDADPLKPGACFFPANPGGGLIACEDGIIIWPTPTQGKRNIGRVNPNGTISAHQTGRAVPAVACKLIDFYSGICGDLLNPGPGLYFGEVTFQLNGFITPDGGASCPLKLTSKGTLFRDIGNGLEEVEIDALYNLVKDKSVDSGCRVQQCRVFARDMNN